MPLPIIDPRIPFEVYVTKYCLSKDIYQATAMVMADEEPKEIASEYCYVVLQDKKFCYQVLRLGRDCFRRLEDAQVDVTARACKKLKALDKQAEKIRRRCLKEWA